ncbi:hypothetical protein ACTDI4_14060 [Mesorhizobium sp. PUT5]|uniref:hypothetical protein n=1 Tax=Mesorhizobium sp. PUT5 TaxID=3454629 RepID=UPI003FA47D20
MFPALKICDEMDHRADAGKASQRGTPSRRGAIVSLPDAGLMSYETPVKGSRPCPFA